MIDANNKINMIDISDSINIIDLKYFYFNFTRHRV